MQNTDLEKKVALFLKEAQPSRAQPVEEIALEKDLFASGWLDSLLQLRLLNFLESEFHIHISPFQFTWKNFQTVGKIADLVREKMK
jgi:acyl carrier protein